MKKQELYDFRKGLNMAKFEHPRATYAINKNKRLVKEEIEDMEKSIAPDDEMKEFIKQREELAKKHSFKDKNGNPKTRKIIEGEGIKMIYDIEGELDEKSIYNKAFKKLEKEFKETVDKHREKEKLYFEEFLKDESDFKPFLVSLDLLERETCSQEVMDCIFYMIKD